MADLARINRKEIALTGLGTSPAAIASYEALQDAAFDSNPAAAQAAQDAADGAASAAAGAQSDASQALTDASTAQTRADDAYALASTAVQQDVGPVWAAATGTLSRAVFASYAAPVISNPPTQAEVQAIADALQAAAQALAAVITDLRGNGALTG